MLNLASFQMCLFLDQKAQNLQKEQNSDIQLKRLKTQINIGNTC